VNWFDLIPFPIRRRLPGNKNRRVTSYHRSRKFAERLEKREYFSNATFGGFTFNPTDANAAAETTDLKSLFALTSTTSVSYTGTINDSGTDSVGGNFSVSVNAGVFSVSATSLTVSEGSLLSASNGSATLALGASSLSGSISGFTVSTGSSQFNLSSLSMNWNTSGSNSFVLNGTGSATIGTGEIAGSFSFNQSGSDVSVGVTNASASIAGGQLSLSGVNLNLDWSSSGFTGNTSSNIATSFSSGGVTFSGNFGVSVNTSNQSIASTNSSGGVTNTSENVTTLGITGQGLSLTVDGVQITSDVTFDSSSVATANASTASVLVTLSNTSLAFGNGTTNYVTLSSPTSGNMSTGSALIQNGSFFGVIAANANVSTPSGVNASGLMVLELNTGSTKETLPDPTSTATTPPTLSLPAGPMVNVLGENINFSLSGSKQITGTFGFSYDNSDPAGSKTIAVSAASVNASFGAASLTNASGGLIIASDGSISGSISGKAGFSSGGTSASGNFTANISGGSAQIVGNNVTINVDNEAFTGSFSVNAQPTYTAFTMTSASLSFGGGLVSVTGLTGSFQTSSGSNYTGSASGTLSATVGQATIAGSAAVDFGSDGTLTLAGTGDTIVLGNQFISGDFNLTDATANSVSNVSIGATNVSVSLGGGLVDVSDGSFSANITQSGFTGSVSGNISVGSASNVQFSGPISVNVSATSFNTSSGAGADTLTVAGQSFTAGFAFSEDSSGNLSLGLSDINMNLGSGALAVSNAQGTLLVGSTGVSGSVSAALSSNIANFSGDLGLSFGGGTVVITASNVSLSVGDNTLTGSMTVTQSGSQFNLSGGAIGATLGGGLVSIVPAPAGTTVPADTLNINNGQITGSFSGEVAAGSSETGASFSGLVSVIVGTNSITASGTGDTLTVGAASISANFGFAEASGVLDLSVSNVNFSLGSALSVSNASGTLAVTSGGITGSASGTISSNIAGLTGGLGVSFAPGAIQISGTNDVLSYGDQTISGGFVFTRNSTGLQLASSNITASLGGGLVLVNNGSATLAVSNTGAVSGSFSGNVSAGSTGNVQLAGGLSVNLSGGTITASGTSDTLTVGGQAITASFNFYENASGLELQISGLNFSLGSALAVSGASGVLNVTSAGVTGSTSGTITSTLAGFSGNIGASFGGGTVSVSGTNDSLTIAGQSIKGNFAFTSVANGGLNLAVSSLNVSLGGGLVTLGGQNGGGANFNISNTGAVSGNFNGYLTAGTGATANFSGGVAVSVGGGNITVSGTGDTLTVAGQSLSGNFGFAEDANAKSLDLTMSNASLSMGSALSVTNASGEVNITIAGISGTISGSVSSSIAGFSANSLGVTFAPGSLEVIASGATLNVGGQSLSGDFDFTDGSSGFQLTSSDLAASLGGGLVTVNNGSGVLSVSSSGVISGNFSGMVAAGSSETGAGFSGLVSVAVQPGSITASGTGDTLTVGGYQLSTNFTFSDTGGALDVGVNQLNFSLGSALSITNASGTLAVTSAGVSGTAAGTISTSFTGVSITGNLGVTFGGGSVSIAGTNDHLIAGSQSIGGNFSFTKDSDGLELTGTNFNASLGGGLVSVANGSGGLTINGGSVAGNFTGDLSAGTVGGGASFSGPITVAVGGGTISASTPVGSVDTLAIAGQSVSAAFAFSDSPSGLELTLSDMSASVGGGAVSLSDGSGQLSITSAGVSGSAAGTLASSFSGFTFTGNLAASFAPNQLHLSGTNDVLTAGDQTLSGNFNFANSNGSASLSASNFTAVLGGGLVQVTNGSGMLNVVNGNLTGGFGGTIAAGTTTAGLSGNISVNVSSGALTATGSSDVLTVGSNSITAGFYFHEDSSGLELTLSGVNLSLGSGVIAVNNAGGTVLVSKSGVSGSIYGGLSANVPNVTFNSTNFSIAFGGGNLSIGGTGVNLTAYGQQLGGNFIFAQNASSVSLAISNLSLSLGGVVNVTGGTGNFTLTQGTGGGMSGSASGNVSIVGSSNATFTGNYSVAVGNGAVKVSGTGDRATIFGQSLTGNFSFTSTGGSVDLHASSLNLSLGGGLVMVSGGAADFNVSQGAITGTASGSLSVGSAESGVSFSGLVSVAMTSTGVTVSGTGCTVTMGSLHLTSNLVFSRDSSTGALDVAISNMTLATDSSSPSVVVSGTLQILPSGMSGTLTGHGMLDGVNGTITATFANGTYSITAGVSTSFSETLDGASISGTVSATGTTGSAGSAGGSGTLALTNLMVSLGDGLLQISGGSATLNESGGVLNGNVSGTMALNGVSGISLGGNVSVDFSNSPASVSVIGTNDTITVLGQTLAGNFSFADAGNGLATIGISNLSLQLANTVSLQNGTANFNISSAGIIGSGSGNVVLTVPGVTFNSTMGLAIDTTNGHSIFTVAGNPATITVGGHSLTGSFAFQKVTTSAGISTESLVAGGINVSIGTANTYVQITNASGALLFLPTGVAVDVSGTAALMGVSGLTLGGTLDVRFNNTGAAVNETVPAPDPNNPGQTINETLKFTANENDVSGTATLAVANGASTFVSLSGGFNIAEQQNISGGVTTTRLLIGAAGLNASLGSGVGVTISNANLGLVVVDQSNVSGATYALTAGGTAALVGVSGLTLGGTLAVESDTAGAISQEIDVPDPKNPGSTIPVQVDFTHNAKAFAGTGLTLAIASGGSTLVSLGGDFTFNQGSGTNAPVDVTVQNATAFVGEGSIGLQLAGGTMGLVLTSAGYALDASGNVSLAGLPGLNVSGQLGIDANTTGANQTNPVDGTTIAPQATPVVEVTGLNFAIDDSSNDPVLSLTVSATIQKSGGVVDIDATSAQMQLNVAGTQVLDVQGSADVTLGSGGFALGPNGFNISSFSILGGTMSPAPAPAASPSAVPSGGAGSSAGGLVPVTPPTLPTGTPRTLGPLSVYNLRPVLKDFSYSNDTLDVNVGLKADAAVLNFGSSNSNGGTEAVFTTLAGSLQLAVGVDPSALKVTSFGPTGEFDLSAGSFVLNVPNVVNVSASNIDISYNPKASSSQQIVSIGTATVTVPFGSGGNGLSGQIAPYTNPSTGVTIPGLVVYGDHFQLGTGTIQYNGTLSFGAAASFTNPFISVSDLSATYSGNLDFNGSITIGAGKVTLGPSSFQFAGSNVAATLTDGSSGWGFSFTAASLGVTLGPVSLEATNVGFDPSATGTNPLVSFSSLSASLALSSITVSGVAESPTGQDIVIDGNGTVDMPSNFAIGINFGAGSSGELGWPTWLPVQISSIVLAWPDFNDDKSDFTLTFSATMNANYGAIDLSGSVQNVTIDIPKLLDGEFPITGIQSASITASGDAFGGQLSGSLILGVIGLDAEDHAVPYGTTPDHTVFYAGIEGSLMTPEGGIAVRFGLTQNGPLQAYVDIAAPIEIFPPADIAITNLYGGISFDAAPLPTISNALDLESSVFAPGNQLTLAQWEIQLQQETINQAGGGSGGYIFSIPENSGIEADLNAGTADTALANDFLNESDPLSGASASGTALGSVIKTTVVSEQAGLEWLIVDGSNFYVINNDVLNSQMNVSKEEFAIDAQDTGADTTVGATIPQLVNDLNSGVMSQQLINAFAAYRVGIDSSAIITANPSSTPGGATTSWKITDNGYTYLITQDAAGMLNVLASGGSMSSVNSVIQIEASVQLGFGGTGGNGISATGDVIIDTDGKVLLNAYVDFGASGTGSFSAAAAINFRCYIDLSGASSYGDAKTFFLFQELVPAGPLGQIPELTIAAGATFAFVDANGDLILPGGAYANATPEGYGIQLDGAIIVEPVPGASLTLTGQAELAFYSDHATLTFDASLSANIEQFLQVDNVVTAAGAFTFYYGGNFKLYGAAELIFDSGAIPFLESAGINADATIFLRINTDASNSHSITFNIPTPGQNTVTSTTVDLLPASFGLYLVGQLSFDKGPVSFVMAGVFDIDFESTDSGWQFDLFAFAEINLGIDGQTLLSLDGLGLLQINSEGFAAMIAVHTGGDSSILSFDFDFSLYVNTTGSAVTYTIPADLDNIIQATMNLSSGGMTNDLLTAMNNEINRVTGKTNTSSVALTIPAGLPTFDGNGNLNANQTNPASPYFVIHGQGDVEILNTVSINGVVQIQATSDGVGIAVNGELTMGPLGDIAASGILDLTSSGMVAAISLGATFNFGPASLFAAAALEINTTGSNQTVKEYSFDEGTGTISSAPVDHVIPASQLLAINAVGRLTIADVVTVYGSFDLTLSDTSLEIGIAAHLDAFFGATVNFEGAAQLDTSGNFALFAEASMGLSIPAVFSVSGDAILEVNSESSSVTLDVPTLGNESIAPGAEFQLTATATFLSMASFGLTGNVTFNSLTDDFLVTFNANANVDLLFLTGGVNVGGWFDSSGQFAVGLQASMGFSFGIGSVGGSVFVGIAWAKTDPTFTNGSPVEMQNGVLVPITPISYSGNAGLTITGDVDLHGSVLGIGIDLNAGIDYSSVTNEFSVSGSVSIHLIFFSISVGFTIDMGSLDGGSPPEIYLAGTTYSGTVDPSSFAGGPLILNVGDRAGNRNLDDSDTNEDIVLAGGTFANGVQTIYVTIDGYGEEFQHVSQVTIPGTGANTIDIANTVHIPVYVTGGSGSSILDGGSGNDTITASGGNDTIEAGSGNDLVSTTSGNNTIVAGAGNDTIHTTGSGASEVLWNADTDGALSLMGDNAGDELVATTDTPGTSHASGEPITVTSNGSDVTQISGGAGNSASVQDVPTVIVNAPAGGNAISIGDLTNSKITKLELDYGATHNAANSVSITGSTGNDTYTLSNSTAALPTLPTPSSIGGAQPATQIAGTIQTVTVADSNGVNITLLGTLAGAGDSLNINSNGGTDVYNIESIAIPTTLIGGGGDDAFTISGTSAPLNIQGGTGTDSFTVDGTGAPITITGQGSDTYNIDGNSSMLTATGGSGVDTFNVLSNTGIMTLNGGTGSSNHNIFNIQGNSSTLDINSNGPSTYNIADTAAPVVINGQTSSATYYVNGPLDAPLTINGSSTLQNLVVTGTVGDDNYIITPTQILGEGAPINYSGFLSVAIDGTGGDDT
jgi:hypothetical protein